MLRINVDIKEVFGYDTEDDASLEHMFCLEIFADVAFAPTRANSAWEYEQHDRRCYIKREELVSDDEEHALQNIANILDSMMIPFDDWVVEDILKFANEMVNDYGTQRKVLRFQVFIVAEVNDDEGYEDESLESLRKHAAENLEEVKVTEGMDTTCSICLNEFEIDSMVPFLPCSTSEVQSGKPHMFHRHCIAKWFETENTCPLCRSKIFSIDLVDV